MRCEYAVLVLMLLLVLIIPARAPGSDTGIVLWCRSHLGCESLYVRIHEIGQTWVHVAVLYMLE